jgi:hypothetical protein
MGFVRMVGVFIELALNCHDAYLWMKQSSKAYSGTVMVVFEGFKVIYISVVIHGEVGRKSSRQREEMTTVESYLSRQSIYIFRSIGS